MSAREEILERLRAARPAGDAAATVAARLAARARGTVPARAAGTAAELAAQFIARAEAAAATLCRVADGAAAVAAVADYLRAENLPPRLRMAEETWLRALPWGAHAPLVEIAGGAPQESDRVALTGAVAGVAETGTLLFGSGPAHPATLNFVVEAQIVLLPASRIVGGYEDAFDRMVASGWPATINLVTGPSRSADIEQTMLLGAHGPGRLHIIVIDDAGDAAA